MGATEPFGGKNSPRAIGSVNQRDHDDGVGVVDRGEPVLRSCFVEVVALLEETSPCFGETGIAYISKNRAKELGVAIRSHKNGDAGVKVWIEFKIQGEMKEFAGAELRMAAEGKHLVSAPLLISRPTADSVSVNFSAAPAYLGESEFWIYVDDVPKGGTAYQFKIRDFVESDESENLNRRAEQQ